jgi:myo-inositol 2-dehydrogenase/D-chiro-inositol 1-dehydrogenase
LDQLKVAIVGAGKVAQNSYLPYLSKEPGVTLGYLSRTRAMAETAAAKFGGEVFDSPVALMAWKPDAVFILTREMDRFDAVMAILEYGPKRLFLEKPLVARAGQEQVTEQDFEDGRRLMHEAERRGCETAMIFNYRFFEHTLLARRIAAERDFGPVVSVVGQTHYACWSHCIDLIHHFAGPIAVVSAQAGTVTRSAGSTAGALTAPDLAATFQTEGGATGTLLGTAALSWEFPLFELAFNFERGRVRMQDLDGDLEIMDSRRQDHERYGIARHRSRWDQYNASFRKSIAAYLDSIRQGQPPPVPGMAGLLELQVEAGFKRSIALGRPVRLAEEFPL